MPEISVIMPVYQVEQYLHQAIDSVLRQTFSDFEILLIDDGSPDGCGRICDEYAGSDSRIRVFHIQNHGVSYARNLGMDQARGTWICFIDPDDWADPTMLEEAHLLAETNHADLVMWNYVMEYPKGKKLGKAISRPIHRLTEEEKLDFQLRMLGSCKAKGNFYWQGGAFPWCKLYRSGLLKENDLQFPLGIHTSEDLCLNYRAMQFAKTVIFLNKPLFHYRQNPFSALHRWTESNFSNIDRVLDLLENFHQTHPAQDPERYRQAVYSRLINTYMLGLQRTYVHKDSPSSFFQTLRLMKQQLNAPRSLEAFQQIDTSAINRKAKIVVFFGKRQWVIPLYGLGWLKQRMGS